MKKYRFNYTPAIIFFIVAVILISGAALGYNIYNLVVFAPIDFAKTILYSVIIFITALLFAFSVSLTFYGCYTVSENYLTMHIGFIKSKIAQKDVVALTHFKKSDKLVVYYGKDKYSVIIINPKNYDAFISDMLSKNKELNFGIDDEDLTRA